jgi:hypothetical protein
MPPALDHPSLSPAPGHEASGDEATYEPSHPDKEPNLSEPTGTESDVDDNEEAELCSRVARTTASVLDDVLEIKYGTPAHPQGEPNKVFAFGCTGEASNYQCVIKVQPNQFCMAASCPLRIPAGHRVRVAEFIARVNFSIVHGHFDLDFSDGELRFRIVQLMDSGLADHPKAIVKIFGFTLSTIDTYFPAIMKLTYGGMSPEEAVLSCED